MNKGVKVESSKINGNGLFATKNYKTGEIILKWDIVDILDEKELDNINTKFVIFAKNQYLRMKAPERFTNHSCSPNMIVKDFLYVAKKDINIGEELTIEYSKRIPLNNKCNCKYPNCKDRNLL